MKNTKFFFISFVLYKKYRNLTLAKFLENFYFITYGDNLAQSQKGQIQPRLYKKGLKWLATIRASLWQKPHTRDQWHNPQEHQLFGELFVFFIFVFSC
jgi:hypothetical protein